MDIRQLLAPAPEAASTPLIRGTCDGRRESWTSASGGDLSSVQFAQQQRIMLHRRRTRKLGGGDESVENFGVRTRDGKEICARCRHLRMKVRDFLLHCCFRIGCGQCSTDHKHFFRLLAFSHLFLLMCHVFLCLSFLSLLAMKSPPPFPSSFTLHIFCSAKVIERSAEMSPSCV